ncbi:MAG: S8 family serine peptidase, partial [Thermoplasmata archaeon]|nr:S8 family serine peptidase [Thermoplasmata archaeon]
MHSERCPTPDVIRSTATATHHRPGPGRSVKPLALAITLLMVFSSGMILLSSSHASGSSDTVCDSDTPSQAAPDTARKGWDWRQMASDSDLVDVILSFRQAGDSDDDEVFSIIDLIEAHSRRGDITLKHVFTNIADGFSARMSPDVLEELLEENPTLEAYPDLQVQAFMGESVLSIGADEIWSMTDPYGHAVTGYGMTIAVIDTGIDYTHPDLGGGFGPSFKVIGGYDFYNHDSDPMDDNGHGTHVAGVVAADGGMIGVAPDARLLAYKSLGSDGAGSMSDVIAAIDAAIDPNGDGNPEDRVDVISMSLGGQGEVGDPICMAVQRAVEAGVVVVVAAGNSGPSMNTVASPGVSPYAVTVGAVDDSGALASFSSRGPTPDMTIKPDLSAPGVNIVSTVPMMGAEMSNPTGYMAMSGTSMATPQVSGAAALLLQLHPDWSPSKVKSALVLGANEIDESVWSAGAGEVWIPESADMRMFYSQPIISYGLIDNPSQSIAITNTGSSVTISADSSDWFSLYADGEEALRQWTNASSISPTQITIPSGATGQMTISIVLENGHPEGYYEGDLILTSSAGVERLPFGFVILSRLAVHVLDIDGHEVFDPYGGVWVFDLPDAEIAMGIRGNIEPAPPATFFLPSGTYSVHSFGHQ